ncbi:uncharacterized protein LOC105769452 [Gossypium raimondii]|uniref:Uncharacterized protein n=1 Tax=Gossypium raimondii TaxID=29730 RepID=A0A0D2TPL3_GOSRA|nr:uncharacterized protein LOC105769452 [Gossypium raimondii]KJB58859.1 hypothetical protein B456_009G229000 [Gossypium raimondii]
MASKLRRWSKDIYISALLGVLLYVTLTTCFHGLHNYLEEHTQVNLADNSVKRQGLVVRSVRDGFTALAIRFLHFLVAKLLQFRHVLLLHQPVPFMPITFWLAFMLSIFHQSL